MAARRFAIVLLAGPVMVLGSACLFGGDDDDGDAAPPPTVADSVAGSRTPGVSGQPPSPTPAASPTPARAETYTVAEGDTLSEIAERFGLTTAELAAANLVEDLDTLSIGQVLKLPPK